MSSALCADDVGNELGTTQVATISKTQSATRFNQIEPNLKPTLQFSFIYAVILVGTKAEVNQVEDDSMLFLERTKTTLVAVFSNRVVSQGGGP